MKRFFYAQDLRFNLNNRVRGSLLLAAAPWLWLGCARPALERVQVLMGTLCEIRAYGASQDDLSAAFLEMRRDEEALSSFIPSSEVSLLNRGGGRARRLSARAWEALRLSARLTQDTRGAFDPTWPSPPALRAWRGVRFDSGTRGALLEKGARLDFGAIGKGLALDHAARVLRARGTRAALLNFGGQVLALGTPPGRGAWEIRLAAPSRRLSPAAGLRVLLRDASLSLSSLDEKPGHIRDPRSARPVLRAGGVGVIAPSAALADAWSTALFVSGKLADAPKSLCAFRIEPRGRGTLLLATPPCAAYVIKENET